MSAARVRNRPTALAILLILGGAIAWYAAFALTLDKLAVVGGTKAVGSLGCNFSVIVQCGVNLASKQGSAFGFPNPLIGLGGFVAPIAVGVGILAGAKFARWFWLLFNLGLAGAMAFIIWLISQSIFVLGTLCPWCMVVWVVVIPMFWAVTLYNLSSGKIPTGPARKFFTAAYGWVPLISLGCYLVIAVLAQLRLDVIGHL